MVLFGGKGTVPRAPGPGTARPGPRSSLRTGRLPGPARRWPMTRPPAPWSCSAASRGSQGERGDAWTWDGSTWTKQAPATSPSVRFEASMAYDAATGTVVLFGGTARHGPRWATPGPGTARPGPSRRRRPARLTGRRVDGLRRRRRERGPVRRPSNARRPAGDTWTWDGTTWTQQHPAASPPARYGASMAYDAATRGVVLFGGNNGSAARCATLGPGTARPGRSRPPRPGRPPGNFVDGL